MFSLFQQERDMKVKSLILSLLLLFITLNLINIYFNTGHNIIFFLYIPNKKVYGRMIRNMDLGFGTKLMDPQKKSPLIKGRKFNDYD